MTKEQALQFIAGIRLGALAGLVLKENVDHGLLAKRIRGKEFWFEVNGVVETALKLDRLAVALEDERERGTVLANMGILLKHAMIRNTFEIILAYADETGQTAVFKAWPPYHFARLVRNVFSHTDAGVLHRWSPNDLSVATWRNRTLTPADVGKEFVFHPGEYVQLQDDMFNFLRDELT